MNQFEFKTDDNRIRLTIAKEGGKWWLAISDIGDASYLSLRDFATKKAAMEEADKIIPVLDKILTKKQRQADETYLHGVEKTFGSVKVIYAPLYTTPQGSGFGSIYPVI